MVIVAAMSLVRLPASASPGGDGQLIGRRAAQRLARAELSRAMYQPHTSIISRILNEILRLLDRLFSVGNSVPGGWWSLVALAVIAVLVVAGIVIGIGPVARAHRHADAVTVGLGTLSARDHRLRAGQLAEAGDYSGAILESVRAIAAELEERSVLGPRAGRTADETADEAGQALPAEAAALLDAAHLFDEICYGKRMGSRPGYDRLRALDARISAVRPREQRVLATAGDGGS